MGSSLTETVRLTNLWNPREDSGQLQTEAYLTELDQLLLSEGINDPFILKAVFMAGGGGSGKGWVSKNMFAGLGLKVVNSDDILEAFSGNPSLRAKFKDLANLRPGQKFDLGKASDMMSPDIQQQIRPRAKQLAKGLLGLYMKGRLGLIIDSTGRQIERVTKTKKLLEEAGYDTSMVFVEVPVETALDRNQQRARKVDPDILVAAHKTIRANKSEFKSAFGGNFAVVDNSDVKSGLITVPRPGGKEVSMTTLAAATSAMRSKGAKLISGPVKNPRGKEWIEAQQNVLKFAASKTESSYIDALDRALTE